MCQAQWKNVLPKQMVLRRLMFCWFSLETYFEKVKKDRRFWNNSILAEIQTPTLEAKLSFTELIPFSFSFSFLKHFIHVIEGFLFLFTFFQSWGKWLRSTKSITTLMTQSRFQIHISRYQEFPLKCHNQVSLRLYFFLLNTAMPIGISEA